MGVVPAEPAAERAYLVTKDLILSGRISAGSLLSEGQIATELNLSRTPVREAFLRLETEELLTLIPKRGAVVTPVSPTEGADILDARLALETSAAHRLATRADLAPVIEHLGSIIARQARASREKDVELFAELDQLFHGGIVTLAGNAIVTRFYATLADRQRRMTVGAVGPKLERLSRLTREHRGLLGCLADRNPAGFSTLLDEHLTATHGSRR